MKHARKLTHRDQPIEELIPVRDTVRADDSRRVLRLAAHQPSSFARPAYHDGSGNDRPDLPREDRGDDDGDIEQIAGGEVGRGSQNIGFESASHPGEDCRRGWKNSAWLISAFSVSCRNGLVNR